MNSQPVIVVLGSTAVGKTQLSLQVAKALDAEIINADSMQLYRGMDIGTAKIPVEQRSGIPHHMLDVLDVTESANVNDYQTLTRALINEIHARGRRVVMVGGTGLFIKAVLEDMNFPPSDPIVRSRLEAQEAQLGTPAMFEKLVSLAPQAAQFLEPNNTRRVLRALEVLEITGQPPITQLDTLPQVVPSIRVGLTREREENYERINIRVHQMLEQGLIAEVETLLLKGLRQGVTAQKALGYAQVLEMIDGEFDQDELADRIMVATRRYSRKQDSWFRRDGRITWLDAREASVDQILALPKVI